MKYIGSKARIAKDIAPIINQLIKDNGINTYIEPFVGGCNMIEHIECEFKYGYDNNEYLIEFWKAIQRGWNPLNYSMTKEKYQRIKSNMGDYPKHIVALAGFCATYNAKWFGGYAGIVETKAGTVRNYYVEAVKNVLKQADCLNCIRFICDDYLNINVKNALIYCDPPYQGKTGYKDDFDHDLYWDWVRKMSESNLVICSEYEAPPDFDCIWEKELTTTLDKSSRSKATEKLFIWSGRQMLQTPTERRMKIYIAGAISNNPDYKRQFAEAEERLIAEGHAVINPVKNEGFSYKEYINMGLCELMHCDAIYLLKGWGKSNGANLEYAYAVTTEMTILEE